MSNFNGGPRGQSFSINAIFPNKFALVNDLRGISYSNVGLNEYVMINYGLQQENPKGFLNNTKTDQEIVYESNVRVDQGQFNKTYNATLWQKIYTKDLTYYKDNIWQHINNYYYLDDIIVLNQNNNPYTIDKLKEFQQIEGSAYCYICLTSMMGITPQIEVETHNIAPKDSAQIGIDNTNIANPKLNFYIPKTREFKWFKKDDGTPASFEDFISKDESGNHYVYLNNVPKEKGVEFFERGQYWIDSINYRYYEVWLVSENPELKGYYNIALLYRGQLNFGQWIPTVKNVPYERGASIKLNPQYDKFDNTMQMDFEIPAGPRGYSGITRIIYGCSIIDDNSGDTIETQILRYLDNQNVVLDNKDEKGNIVSEAAAVVFHRGNQVGSFFVIQPEPQLDSAGNIITPSRLVLPVAPLKPTDKQSTSNQIDWIELK